MTTVKIYKNTIYFEELNMITILKLHNQSLNFQLKLLIHIMKIDCFNNIIKSVHLIIKNKVDSASICF